MLGAELQEVLTECSHNGIQSILRQASADLRISNSAVICASVNVDLTY